LTTLFLAAILPLVQENDPSAERVEALEREIAEIRAFLWPKEKPSKRNPKPKLSKAARRRLNQLLAARARAAKKVGDGKGCVSNKQIQRKLRQEAK